MRRLALAGLAIGSIGVVAACTPVKPPTPEPETIVVEFEFTNGPEEWDVPAGVDEITVAAAGAAGGTGIASANEADLDPAVTGSGGTGGLGGAAVATLAVTEGETLQINVGGAGEDGVLGDSLRAVGGFNGGGAGNDQDQACVNRDAHTASGAGGGASDVRRGAFGLGDRLVVAGGGGGGGSPYAFAVAGLEAVTDGGSGGGGGGLVGTSGSGATPGGGGTQSVGGAPGSTPLAS